MNGVEWLKPRHLLEVTQSKSKTCYSSDKFEATDAQPICIGTGNIHVYTHIYIYSHDIYMNCVLHNIDV